jgi:transposase
MARKSYDHDFRINAVNLVTQQGYTYQKAADALGVSAQTLQKWVMRFKTDPDSGEVIDKDAEIRRLRRENRTLRMEKDILKKAAAFFAKENP